MRDHVRDTRGELGSFIVDDHNTILGFDLGMELLTGWPAMEVVGRPKSRCGGLAIDADASERISPASGALYDGMIPVNCNIQSMQLKLNCRDGRVLETEAITERLSGTVDRARVTVLRVLALSAVSGSRRASSCTTT